MTTDSSDKEALKLLRGLRDPSVLRAPDAISGLDPTRRAEVLARAVEIPQTARGNYFRAVLGQASPRNAIKAQCMECICWVRAEVTNCTGRACPLYAYPPYQKERKA